MTPQTAAALDAAWRELEADAFASDGPVRDSDVKDAIRRNRPHIEAAISQPVPDLTVERLAAALHEAEGHRYHKNPPSHYPDAMDRERAAAILTALSEGA